MANSPRWFYLHSVRHLRGYSVYGCLYTPVPYYFMRWIANVSQFSCFLIGNSSWIVIPVTGNLCFISVSMIAAFGLSSWPLPCKYCCSHVHLIFMVVQIMCSCQLVLLCVLNAGQTILWTHKLPTLSAIFYFRKKLILGSCRNFLFRGYGCNPAEIPHVSSLVTAAILFYLYQNGWTGLSLLCITCQIHRVHKMLSGIWHLSGLLHSI